VQLAEPVLRLPVVHKVVPPASLKTTVPVAELGETVTYRVIDFDFVVAEAETEIVEFVEAWIILPLRLSVAN
jgi:hypothetical protein